MIRPTERVMAVWWPSVLFCALFAAMLVHGVEGALTHSHPGTEARYDAAAPAQGDTALFPSRAVNGEESVHEVTETAGAPAESHAHGPVECLGVVATTVTLLGLAFWARSLACPLPPPLAWTAERSPPAVCPRRVARVRSSRRLLLELSVLRI